MFLVLAFSLCYNIPVAKEKDGGVFQKRKDRKMKNTKRRTTSLLAGILSAIFIFSLAAIPAAASSDTKSASPSYESIPITLDGKKILGASAYLIGGNTYVPLRAFSDAIGNYEISWNDYTRTATVKKGDDLYISATPGKQYISVNGRYFYTVGEILNVEGRLYVPIRPLAKAFALELEWDNATRSVSLKSTGQRTKWANEVYNTDDLYWLSRIINAESGQEPMLGKIAVGNVVLNRKRSSQYPNTIYGVIFDRKHGLQFSPVGNGTIYNTPNTDSVIAAKICLEGYSLSNDILFFLNPRIATSFWIVNNCTFVFSIGRHDFYK